MFRTITAPPDFTMLDKATARNKSEKCTNCLESIQVKHTGGTESGSDGLLKCHLVCASFVMKISVMKLNLPTIEAHEGI